MILKTFTLLALILILSSCMSYRYMGSTDAEYGDNTKTERNVALQINFFSGFYLKRELKAALVKKGFDGLHFGKGYKGYSIEVGVESKMKETLGFFALSAISLTFLPYRHEITYSIDVSYYNNGNLIRSSSYQTILYRYTTLFSPIGSFWPDTEEEAYRKMAKDLAKNITLDFPKDDKKRDDCQLDWFLL